MTVFPSDSGDGGVSRAEGVDAAHCRQVVRAHARTFWLASSFLPAAKRRAAFALYAFCRIADDIVDVRASGGDALQLLAEYRHALELSLAGHPTDAVFREMALAARTFGIPVGVLHELLDGVSTDCGRVSFDDWQALERYCDGVASSVGEMCTHIFGVAGDSAIKHRALLHARTLGVAMQLTNVLRDVGEDTRRGRCYLPLDDLARFGLTRDDVLSRSLGRDDRWRALMVFQVARARALYAEALPGIALLEADSRRCATACAAGYAAILDAIEALNYDTFRTRARLSGFARASVLWNVWRAPLHPAATLPVVPVPLRNVRVRRQHEQSHH